MPKKEKSSKDQLKPPYHVNIGDRIYPDVPNLKKGHVIRNMCVTTKPYLVNGEWRMMVQDTNQLSFSTELPLIGFHVVGRSASAEDNKKPDLVKGDVVQLKHCPKYPSLESHTATLTSDPYIAFGVWQAPIRYNCIGVNRDIYKCCDMAFIRHAIIKISFWKSLYNKVKDRYMKLSRPAIITGVVLGVMAIMFLWTAGNYNQLVHSRNAVTNSKSKIDTQLTRRYELIDNIVSSVKGSQAQESDVFGKIAAARKIGGSSTNPEQQAEANAQIDTQIALLPRLQEAYPELRSNDQVSKLIAELQGTANSIREARDNYNNTATNYNNNVSSFPKNIFAGMFNFDQAKLFEASSQEKVNPKVDFSKNEN